jgi:hypothetical protein
MKRFTLHGLVGLVVVAMVSCGASANTSIGYSLRSAFSHLPGLAWVSPITPLGSISRSSQQQTLQLSGRVATQIPLVNAGLYQLVDDSGSIWVETTDPLPPQGSTVTISAMIHYEQILVLGQDIGEHYAVEQARRSPE